MKLRVIVEQGEDGYFVAHCPSLRSCWTQGKTVDEAIKNIKEAITLYLEDEDEYTHSNNSQVHELIL